MRVIDISEIHDPEFRNTMWFKQPTIVIPVGSIEQHGAHLHISTDSDIVTGIASRLAKTILVWKDAKGNVLNSKIMPSVEYTVSTKKIPRKKKRKV